MISENQEAIWGMSVNSHFQKFNAEKKNWDILSQSLGPSQACSYIMDSSSVTPMTDYRRYWDQNIDRWGDLYLEISHGHEVLDAPAPLRWLYNNGIARYEAKLMKERYERAALHVRLNAEPGEVFADIGCGTGIFSILALQNGATVHAIDFSEKALTITKTNVEKHVPDGDIEYNLIDVQKEPLPRSDFALAMGVTPYIEDIETFPGNVLPHTRQLFIQYNDPGHWANRLRTQIPVLNVRNLVFHSPEKITAAYTGHGWRLVRRYNFATGFIDLARSPAIAKTDDEEMTGMGILSII
jgi:SAM-dependent methyltransferase